MKKLFSRFKDTLRGGDDTEVMDIEEEYVELDGKSQPREDGDGKVVVRPFIIEDFSDIKDILNDLRAGYTVAIINIKPLKDKDMIELKRAVNKLKKTCDAIKGEIAGFGDDYIIAAPSFAKIYRSPAEPKQ